MSLTVTVDASRVQATFHRTSSFPSMSTRVCLCADTICYPEGGGHQWVYLNWALGLRALGCQVIWLELVDPRTPAQEIQTYVAALRSRLNRYDLGESISLCSETGEPLSPEATVGCLDLELAADADLLLDLGHKMQSEVVKRFRRSALLDIDPAPRATRRLLQHRRDGRPVWCAVSGLGAEMAVHAAMCGAGLVAAASGGGRCAIHDCGSLVRWRLDRRGRGV